MERADVSRPAMRQAGLLASALMGALCAAALTPLLAQTSPHSLHFIISLIFAAIGGCTLIGPRHTRAANHISAALTGGSATLAMHLDSREGLALGIFALIYGTAMTGLVQRRHSNTHLANPEASEIRRLQATIDDALACTPNSRTGWYFETSASGHIQYASEEFSSFTGREPVELRGLPFEHVIVEGRTGAGWDRLLLALKAEQATNCIFAIRDDMEYCWWQVTLRPMSDAEGRFSGHCGIAHDVTAESQAHRQLTDTSSQKDQQDTHGTLRFLEEVIMEVRPPLNTILGFAEILHSPAACDLAEDERHTYHQLMLDCSRQLSAFMADVGDMLRIDANHFHLIEQEVDAAELTEIAMKFCGVVAEEADTIIIVNVIENVELRCDAARVRRVLVSLVTRAAKAGRSGTSVNVTFARRPDGGLDILVIDQGHVLSREAIAQAFEPSFHNSGMDGLSLPIARRIALLHGGRLTIEPAPGGGMCARLSLPSSRVTWKSAIDLETVNAA